MLSALRSVVSVSLVLSLGYLALVTAVTLVAAIRAGGRREDEPEEREALSASRLTIPVSVVIRAGQN